MAHHTPAHPPSPLPEPLLRLQRLLAGPLPGRAAQRAAWPDHLPGQADPIEAETYGPAAVLLALIENDGRLAFPLIRRPGGEHRHAGQISLPGGQQETGEDLEACALREAEEEIGLSPQLVRLLGRLTPVPVAVSRYRIQPVVGWIRRAPSWAPRRAEVEELLWADPDRLLREGPRSTVRRERAGFLLEAPAYVVPSSTEGEALVWGATAIILAEFLALWGRVRETRPPDSPAGAGR